MSDPVLPSLSSRAALRRRLLAVATVLIALSAVSAQDEYHVLMDLDADGNADPCPNVEHRRHYTTDSVTCNGGRVDIDGDGIDETIFCDLQRAANLATGNGDTVDVHAGTWTEEHSSPRSIRNLCVKDQQGQALLTVRSGSATQESHRRLFRAAEMQGSTDRTVLAPGPDVEAPIVLGQEARDNVRFVTIRGFEITEVHWNGCNNSYLGAINLSGDADDLIVEGIDFQPDAYDTVEENAVFTSETGIVFIADVGFNTSRDTDRVEIRNNRSRTSCWIGVKGSTTCPANEWDRWDIHDNEFWVLGTADVQCEMKSFTDVAIWNNTFRSDLSGGNATASWKFRASGGRLYLFNNYFEGVTKWYNQSACFEEMNLFNNSAAGAGGYFLPPPSGTYRGRNNSVADDAAELYKGLGPTSSVGFDHFTGSKFRYTNSPPGEDLGHQVCNDDAACGSVASYDECGGSGGCNASSVVRTGPPPWRLTHESVLIDAGTNDPIGQGRTGARSSSGPVTSSTAPSTSTGTIERSPAAAGTSARTSTLRAEGPTRNRTGSRASGAPTPASDRPASFSPARRSLRSPSKAFPEPRFARSTGPVSGSVAHRGPGRKRSRVDGSARGTHDRPC
jgi:hypothetical protein